MPTFAEPLIRWGTSAEVDVATLDLESSSSSGGGVQTAVWSPPHPTQTVAVDFSSIDVAEVLIRSDETGPQLVAAIELVSPANKDRASHLRAFVTKCAAYLQSGVAVVVVDIVTSRRADWHPLLIEFLTGESGASDQQSGRLSAAAYRLKQMDAASRVEVWQEILGVGEDLPMLPLWLNQAQAVPLELSESYEAACRALRIG